MGVPGAAVPLTALTEEQRRQARERFNVLRPCLMKGRRCPMRRARRAYPSAPPHAGCTTTGSPAWLAWHVRAAMIAASGASPLS